MNPSECWLVPSDFSLGSLLALPTCIFGLRLDNCRTMLAEAYDNARNLVSEMKRLSKDGSEVLTVRMPKRWVAGLVHLADAENRVSDLVRTAVKRFLVANGVKVEDGA